MLEFSHSKVRHLSVMLPALLIGTLIGYAGTDHLSGREFSFARLWPMSLGVVIGCGMVIGLNKPSKYRVSINGSALIGPSSYASFAKQNKIDLERPFDMKRLWTHLPVLSYKVTQGKNKVLFSSMGIGRANTKKCHAALMSYQSKE